MKEKYLNKTLCEGCKGEREVFKENTLNKTVGNIERMETSLHHTHKHTHTHTHTHIWTTCSKIKLEYQK